MIFIRAILFIFLASCQSSQTADPNDGLSSRFQRSISSARSLFSGGETQEAISSLRQIDDSSLTSSEVAYKYNLVGSYFYSLRNFGAAEKSFEQVFNLSGVREDITSQVALNLAVSEEAQKKSSEAFAHIKAIDPKALPQIDIERYYKISSQIAAQQSDYWFASNQIISYLNLLTDEEKQGAVEFDQLKYNFRLLDKEQRKNILQKNNLNSAEPVLLMAMVETLLVEGETDGVGLYLDRLDSSFSKLDEVRNFTARARNRIKYLSKMEPLKIGVLLPFTGDKARFGQKVMKGIDLALSQLNRPYELIIRDDKNSPALGKAFVRELVMDKSIAFFIGGLFSEVAEAEYLTAKSFNSIFISLSSMNLDVEQKNSLLFEVLGSVQSQVESILESQKIKGFGNRVGVFHTESDSGKMYVDELWRQQSLGKIQITALSSFSKEEKDFRDSIQKFLAINLERERSEELSYWKQISDLQKKGWIKRTQLLNPVLDFDWIFLPVNPKKALALIPVFQYYEARRMRFIGGPSWKSSQLLKNYLPQSSMFFVGDWDTPRVAGFKKAYYRKFNKNAGLLQLLGYEALQLVDGLNAEESSRSDLLKKINELPALSGFSTNWFKKNRIWVKKMKLLGFQNGQIAPVY